jgi:hypothetical protein
MRLSCEVFRKVMILSILLAFMANEAVSFLATPKIKSITKTAVYQFNEAVKGVPAPVVEPVTKLAVAFILLQLFLPLLRVLRSKKIHRTLRIPVADRNPFYRHVSINAP